MNSIITNYSDLTASPFKSFLMKKEKLDDEINKLSFLNYQQRKIDRKEEEYFLKQNVKSGSVKQKSIYEQGVLCVYDCLMIMGM